MPARWLLSILPLVLVVPLHAQVIEHAVANSDLVVLGRLAGRTADDRTIVIHVIQTFKGGHHAQLVLRLREPIGNLSFPDYRRLEFLVFAAQPQPHLNVVDEALSPIDPEGSDFLWDVEFQQLKDRASVLAAVRAAVVAYPHSRAYAPPDATVTVQLHGDFTWKFPNDARTQRAMARAAHVRGENSWRWWAIMVLHAMNTDAARGVLRELLADTEVERALGEGKWGRGPYNARNAAALALASKGPDKIDHWDHIPRQWNGVPLEGPVLGYRIVRRPWLWPAIFAIVSIVWLTIATHRRSFSFALNSLLTAATLAAAVALIFLHVRSRHVTDELMLRLGPSHHELASRNGRLVYTLVSDWSPPPEPAMDDWMYSRRLHLGHFPAATTPDHWSPNAPPRFARLGFSMPTGTIAGPFGGGHAYRLFTLPLWLLAALLSIPPANAAFHHLRRLRRRRHGRCERCGYDLRATPTHCPECGVAAPAI
jgi:hypothetical protein